MAIFLAVVAMLEIVGGLMVMAGATGVIPGDRRHFWQSVSASSPPG